MKVPFFIYSPLIYISISWGLLRVKVKQSFKNNHDQWMEGKYQFPLPEKAAVDHLSIKIGERIIIGEIKKKQEAKKIYHQAKLAGKKASLIEQQRPNLFSNSIANIAPYESITVTIEYQQDVQYNKSDGFSIRFPMTITPRYQPSQPHMPTRLLTEEFDHNISSNPEQLYRSGLGFIQKVSHASIAELENDTSHSSEADQQNMASIRVELDSGIALQSILSPTHKIYNQQKTERKYEISFSQVKIKADHDFVLKWKPSSASTPRAAIFTERKAGENYISMMVMPPSLESKTIDSISRETIFVIDTSGSMSRESMKQAKNALIFGLSTLSKGDRFNIIQFNSTSEKLFGTSLEADHHNLQIATDYVVNLDAEGGTEMFSALEMSLDTNNHNQSLRQIIFLTDGAVSNEAELFELIDSKLGDSRLYTVGIGSAPNAFFMKKAARFGRGTFTYIANINDAQVKIQKLFERVSRPQLTHIDIKWPDNISEETWPKRIPDLYDGQPLWLKSKISRLNGQVGLSGRLGDTLWHANFSLNSQHHQSGVAVLWAREKIASIMNAAFHGQVDEQQKQQIIDTALEHHLVSRFTSLVAIDKTPSRIAEQLQKEILRNAKLEGYKRPNTTSSINFAATSLDLDLEFRTALILLLASLGLLFVYRRFA
ncbi:MAG: marine proteobacterial sortase target protein [Kangiellaceae bacterium]|nr:marine proteobacterial sortase target protein [Kangiellaceae bacterium]